MSLGSIFALPGIVIHELGHYLVCRLVGARVQDVVFFDPAGPSGYVVHAVPHQLRQHLVIVVGPLLLNSALGFLLFRAVVATASGAEADLLRGLPLGAAQALLAGMLGASIALQAIPSRADARSLWNVSLDRLAEGNLLAIGAIPVAVLLIALNRLRRFWIDWLYLAALAGLAAWFPMT
ncbi:MAG: hypothetical protein ACRDIY_15185 [Chloroflexota bacterium]